jgi:hypothetical protein
MFIYDNASENWLLEHILEQNSKSWTTMRYRLRFSHTIDRRRASMPLFIVARKMHFIVVVSESWPTFTRNKRANVRHDDTQCCHSQQRWFATHIGASDLCFDWNIMVCYMYQTTINVKNENTNQGAVCRICQIHIVGDKRSNGLKYRMTLL